MDLIVNLSLILICIGLCMYARYWRKMCGKTFCQYAAACREKEDRKKLLLHAVMAGNRQALLLYALTFPEQFDKARPLRLFEFGGIRCVFTGYYFPQRYKDWICDSQADFVERVYAFKDGRDICRDCFSRAMQVLPIEGTVTAMFMPCSTSHRYHRRFSGIASFLEKEGYALSGLDLICITEERESKHASGRRSGIDTANYLMANSLQGKNVVIVDDLLTSGDSLMEYAHNLERVGAKVVGAVFLARTFQIPSPTTIRRVVWKRHVSLLLSRK